MSLQPQLLVYKAGSLVVAAWINITMSPCIEGFANIHTVDDNICNFTWPEHSSFFRNSIGILYWADVTFPLQAGIHFEIIARIVTTLLELRSQQLWVLPKPLPPVPQMVLVLFGSFSFPLPPPPWPCTMRSCTQSELLIPGSPCPSPTRNLYFLPASRLCKVKQKAAPDKCLMTYWSKCLLD